MWGSISLLLWFCFLRSLNVFKYISGHDKMGEVYKILKQLLSSVRLNTSIWMLLSFIFHCPCTALCTRLQMMVPLQSTVGLIFCWVTAIIWLISLWLFATASHGWICIAVRKEVGWGVTNNWCWSVSVSSSTVTVGSWLDRSQWSQNYRLLLQFSSVYLKTVSLSHLYACKKANIYYALHPICQQFPQHCLCDL